MTDEKNKTANQDHQVARTQSNSDNQNSEENYSDEHAITQNKTIIKNQPAAGNNNSPTSKQAAQSQQAAANQQARVQANPMPSMDDPTRLQGMDNEYADLKQNPPLNKAYAAGKNLSAEFAQGLVSLPKKLITAYQTYTEESSGNSITKQFALVILTCIIFYVWTLVRSPLLMTPKVTSESKVLMVDIIELLQKGERKKANILIKKAAEVEKDEKLAKKLQDIAR